MFYHMNFSCRLALDHKPKTASHKGVFSLIKDNGSKSAPNPPGEIGLMHTNHQKQSNFVNHNFETEAPSPKLNIFSESWVHKDSVGTSPKKIPVKIFGYVLSKNHFFANFRVPAEKMLRHRVRWILMPPTSHRAILNHYTPRSPNTTQHMTWCHRFGAQGLPKSGYSDSSLPK